MLILYGTRNFKRVKGKSTRFSTCPKCKAIRQWQLVNVWTWFTLFFIPLFPVWKKKMLLCPNCSCGIKITGKNRELLDNVQLSSFLKKDVPAGQESVQVSSTQVDGIEKPAENEYTPRWTQDF